MMNFIVFIVVYPVIWLLSILPFRLLYFISDFVFLFNYHIIKYRKKVVISNLQLSYPNKSERELSAICKEFYHHFTDIFIEMIKTFTISRKELSRRYSYTNLEFLDELQKDGKSVILIGSHYANWEWMTGLGSFIPKYKGYAAYTKINNRYLNLKILKSRSRFEVVLKQTSKIISVIENNQKQNIQSIYGLLSDQSPSLKKTFYRSQFLGVNVPIHTGSEMLAKKYDMNMVMIKTKKVKRGFYESTFSLISKDVQNYPNYQLTDIFLRELEHQIHQYPAHYFWTHKRFKHKEDKDQYTSEK